MDSQSLPFIFAMERWLGMVKFLSIEILGSNIFMVYSLKLESSSYGTIPFGQNLTPLFRNPCASPPSPTLIMSSFSCSGVSSRSPYMCGFLAKPVTVESYKPQYIVHFNKSISWLTFINLLFIHFWPIIQSYSVKYLILSAIYILSM